MPHNLGFWGGVGLTALIVVSASLSILRIWAPKRAVKYHNWYYKLLQLGAGLAAVIRRKK